MLCTCTLYMYIESTATCSIPTIPNVILHGKDELIMNVHCRLNYLLLHNSSITGFLACVDVNLPGFGSKLSLFLPSAKFSVSRVSFSSC